MDQFFAADYSGPAFEYLSTAHIAALAFFILLNLFLIRYRHADDKTKNSIRLTLALILLVN
jgi:hypothetical protein